MCVQKHVLSELNWYEVVNITSASYNLVQNKHSKESVFSLCLNKCIYIVSAIDESKQRHIGNDKSLIALDDLKDIYLLAIHNIF